MPSSEYTVNILIKSKDQTSKPAKKASAGLEVLKSAAKFAATAFVALKAAQKAIDFVKFGARIDRAAKSLDTLAKASGSSGEEIIKSIRAASDFQIDRMGAMDAANKAMLLGVADSPAEFERLTKQAVLLGRAMGKDAASSIDDFVTAAGRQSKMIADNLGLMVGVEDANKRYAASLGVTVGELDDTAKKQAFLTEMLRQAELKTVALGEQTANTADKIDTISGAVKTAGQVFSESFAVAIGEGITGTKDFGEALAKAEPFIRATAASVAALVSPAQTTEAIKAWKEAGVAAFDMGTGVEKTAIRIERYNTNVERSVKVTQSASGANYDYGDSTEDAESGTLDLGRSLGKGSVAYREIARAAEIASREMEAANREFLMGASADFTSFIKVQEKDAKDLAEDKEAIEKEHQDKLAAIRKKGRSTAVRLDATAEQDKLDELRFRLDQAILKRSEVTDKTKQSSINQKDHAIATLTEQVGAQEQLLADYHAGRLVNAGQNITGLLTAEQARYDEEKRLLDESRTEQEIAQNESLGRMVLAHFTAWADINNVAQAEIFKTQLFIQEKYGLITQEGADMALAMTEDFQLIKEVGIDAFKQIKAEQDRIARHIELTFSVRQTGREAAEAEFGSAIPGLGTPNMASGGTAPGGSVMVGEMGPEMVSPPRGSQVSPASQTTQNYTFNQTVNTRATTHSINDDFALAEALAV